MQPMAENIAIEQKNVVSPGMPETSETRHPASLRTEDIIFPEDTSDRPDTRYGYRIGNLHFLVPEKTVSEIIQSPSIFTLPNAPVWVEGLMNVRGSIVPVMNLGKLIKNENHNNKQQVLVLNKVNMTSAIALIIDGLPQSLVYEENTVSKEHYPAELSEFLGNGFQKDNTNWIEFDPQGLFEKISSR